MRNGLIIEPIRACQDWYFGQYSGISNEKINPSGRWDGYLPALESQRSAYFDSMSCVSFSLLNCLETLLQFHKSKNFLSQNDVAWFQNEKILADDFNFSDRGLASLSGTTQAGNTMSNVVDCANNIGLVAETKWNWDKKQIKTFTDFIQLPPVHIISDAQKFSKNYEIQHDWVRDRDMAEALKCSPLWVGVYAWGISEYGIQPRTEKIGNHCVMIYGKDDVGNWLVFDHYDNSFRKLAPDFLFWGQKRIAIINKQKPMEIANNTLLQLVEGEGGFGLFLDGQIIVDDLAKVQASWIMRSKDFSKKMSVTQEVWDAYPKINLKKQSAAQAI